MSQKDGFFFLVGGHFVSGTMWNRGFGEEDGGLGRDRGFCKENGKTIWILPAKADQRRASHLERAREGECADGRLSSKNLD